MTQKLCTIFARRIQASLLLGICLLLSCAYFPLHAQAAEPAQVSLKPLQERSLLRLEGPWEFYWQKLLTPKDPLPEPDAYSAANVYWSDLTLRDGKKPTRTGYASYRLLLKDLTETRQEFMWLQRAIVGSGRMYLYPEQRPEAAYEQAFGWNAREQSAPVITALRQTFEAQKGETWVLLVQVHYPKALGWKSGGLFTTSEIGFRSKIERIYQFYSFELAVSFGIALFVALASGMLFLHRPTERASLFLGLFSALFAMRTLFYCGLYFKWWSPELRFAFLFDPWTRIGMIASLIGYFAVSFPQQSLNPRILQGLQGLNLLAALVHLLAVMELVTISMSNRLTSLSHLAGLIFCFIIGWRAARQRPLGVGLLLFGFLGFVAAGMIDLYFTYHQLSPNSIPMLPIGICLFLISQSQLVAVRFARTLRKVEEFAKEIADKEKARTLFFQNTSHELRTPLNGILGFLELMQTGRYGPITERLSQQIGKCRRLTEGLKLQVDTILDIAKARRGGLATRMQKFSLQDLLLKTNTLAEGLLSRSKLLSYSGELQIEGEESVYFISDKEKIFAILRNLIGNALKFSDPQRPNHVRLRLDLKPGLLLIEVHDTGIGIAPEHHQRIFEEFSQVETHAQRRYEGTGLGLTMVRDFIQVLGGNLELRSKLGEGSSFFIRIPEGTLSPVTHEQGGEQTLIQTLEQASAESQVTPSLAPSSVGHGWDILVIDDNPSNCELIHDILEQDSFHVRTALSGAEGLRSMRRQKPHILLLDMMMPEMSGEDVLAVLRKDPELADIAVVIITARASEDDRILGLSLGADDYLAKPIFAAELRLRVQNLIHRQKLTRQAEQIESQAKLTQLGELFRDLSHELKNIFQGGLNGGALNKTQVKVSLEPLGLEQLPLELVSKSLMDGSCMLSDIPRSWPWNQKADPACGTAQIRNLGQLLAGFPFSEDEWTLLVNELLSKPEEELLFLENQMNLLVQVRSLQQSLLLGRELALSTLVYTRTDDTPCAQVEDTLKGVQAMTKARLRRHQIDLKAKLDGSNLAIPPGHLMQILLNLVLNAIDAIQNLEPHERWIQVGCHSSADQVELHVDNGGPPIPPEVQAKLFERGFSTKGSQGSGIGLHVSIKLARQAKGELSYDPAAAHPRFILLLPTAKDAALAS